MITNYIKVAFKILGFDIRRLKNVPSETLLGLGHRSITTVIDVGANEGQFIKYIQDFFPNAVVHCFEPLPVPFKNLKAWADSQTQIIKCHSMALGEKSGSMPINFHVDHTSSSSFLITTDHEERIFPQTRRQQLITVEMSTLDEFFAAEPPSGDILLKLDVQGYEGQVLRGGEKLIENVSICILEVCLDQLYKGQAKYAELHDIMNAAGMKFAGNLTQVYGDDGRIIYMDSVYVRE